jgi:hypothetical protein
LTVAVLEEIFGLTYHVAKEPENPRSSGMVKQKIIRLSGRKFHMVTLRKIPLENRRKTIPAKSLRRQTLAVTKGWKRVNLPTLGKDKSVRPSSSFHAGLLRFGMRSLLDSLSLLKIFFGCKGKSPRVKPGAIA